MCDAQLLEHLDSSILFDVITVMHEKLYGYSPFQMVDWSNKQLVSWFQEHYVFDDNTEMWYSILEVQKVH